jgi:hypothetical protein
MKGDVVANVDPQAAAARATQGIAQEIPLDAAAHQRVQAALSDALSTELARGAGAPNAIFGQGSIMGLTALQQLQDAATQLGLNRAV